jgi:hypothetical protein
MARYDPYDRGDNPLRLDIDRLPMQATRPAARTKPAAAPAKKKVAAPASPPRRPEPTTTGTVNPRMAPVQSLPPTFGPAAQPSEGLIPEVQGPPIPSGLLAGPTPAILNNLPPPPPVNPIGGERGPGLPRYGVPPDLQREPPGPNPALTPTQTTGADQMGASLMNYLRSQLFNQGKPFDPNQPSGSIY